jgi:hypothetical protein
MNVKVLTAATEVPITTAKLIDFLLPGSTESSIGATETANIEEMRTAAVQAIERTYNLAVNEQTLIVDFDDDSMWNNKAQLPRFPQKGYVADEFLAYSVDAEGTETALTKNSGFFLYGSANWFEVDLYPQSSIVGASSSSPRYKVQYIAGYGIDNYTEALPQAIIQCIKMLVADWYNNRDNWSPVINEGSKVDMTMRAFSKNSWL